MTQIDARRLEPATPAGACEAAASPWQFSLRDVFWFTTYAAVAALLARFKSPGSLVLSLGMGTAWLNYRGRISHLQTARARPKVFWGAWLLLLASLFLPAAKGCNNQKMAGWETAVMCAQAEVSMTGELVARRSMPSGKDFAAEILSLGRLTLLNAANVLALLSPLLLWRLQRETVPGGSLWGKRMGAALAVASVAVWAVPLDSSGVLIGCYVWCAGFLALTLSYRIGLRTFILMAALAVLFLWS